MSRPPRASRLAVLAPLVLTMLAVLPACGDTTADTASDGVSPADDAPLRVLVLSGGGYHDFEGNTALLLDGLAVRPGRPFTFERLRLGPDAPADRPRLDPASVDVILAYTQGELGLDDTERSALLSFVRAGGGYVALHSAGDSHPGWTEYDELVGGRFESHPPFGPITVEVVDGDVALGGDAIVADVPKTWTLEDEFYHLALTPNVERHRLLEGTSPAGGDVRPVAWVKRYGDGRVFYTILGHGAQTHGEARFRQMVARALRWAADA